MISHSCETWFLVSCFTEDTLVSQKSMFGVTVNNNRVDECSVFVRVVCLRDLESNNFDLLPKETKNKQTKNPLSASLPLIQESLHQICCDTKPGASVCFFFSFCLPYASL